MMSQKKKPASFPAGCISRVSFHSFLAAAHAVATVEAFVASATPDGDMSAGIAGRRIALHAFGSCIQRIEAAGFSFHC